MNRLQSELHRLYLSGSQARAIVMELTRPPSWEVLSSVWHGVQTELDLPTPAIAVSGIDGLQLWFSLEEPIAVSQAHAFLEGLRTRFLPDVDPNRIRLMPAGRVPALQEQTGNWSAFVAPDLAPVFAETPWLDIPPNEEGQAALLRGLKVMKQADFEAALKRLAPSPQLSPSTATMATNIESPLRPAQAVAAAAASQDPNQFLLQVMNDTTVPLALRIDAAKALLQYSSNDRQSPRRD